MNIKYLFFAVVVTCLLGACSKIIVHDNSSSAIQTERSTRSADEALPFSKVVNISSTNGQVMLTATVSTASAKVLTNYLADNIFVYTSAGMQSSQGVTSSSPEIEVYPLSDPEQIQICLHDEHLTTPFTITTRKARSSGWYYVESFSSTSDFCTVDWLYVSHTNNAIRINGSYKNCAFCTNKFSLGAPVFLDAATPVVTLGKANSRRIYIDVRSNWKNRNLTFFN